MFLAGVAAASWYQGLTYLVLGLGLLLGAIAWTFAKPAAGAGAPTTQARHHEKV